jgi:hypothetical protein
MDATAYVGGHLRVAFQRPAGQGTFPRYLAHSPVWPVLAHWKFGCNRSGNHTFLVRREVQNSQANEAVEAKLLMPLAHQSLLLAFSGQSTQLLVDWSGRYQQCSSAARDLVYWSSSSPDQVR